MLVEPLGLRNFRRTPCLLPSSIRYRNLCLGLPNLSLFQTIHTAPLGFLDMHFIMPSWLQVISQINPLTYEVDALRSLMVIGGSTIYGIVPDLAILSLAMTTMVLLAARLYPKVIVLSCRMPRGGGPGGT